MRKLLVKANFSKTTGQRLALIPKMLRPSNFIPDISPQVEFTTNKNMGQHCEVLNKKFDVSRDEQDAFAARSHSNAFEANKSGLLSDIAPLVTSKGRVDEDNGIRVASKEKLSKLKAVFKKDGSVTAANASYLTDGASCTLLMSEQKALDMGLKPKAVLVDWTYASLDPTGAGLLLGPSYATAKLLKKNKMTFDMFDVFEYHEAFSGQLLANLKAMDDNEFCQNELDSEKLGLIPMDKLNCWGGSVSLGHPFGATGSRLVNMAANRLIESGGKRALIGSCAAGGLGHSMILERYVQMK
jgi:acetyl-CoA acyltransferase